MRNTNDYTAIGSSNCSVAGGPQKRWNLFRKIYLLTSLR